ncbi:four-carbon acid sugar kinase family protein [Actinoallomurus sp. NBC_01490]|uniref:four-carbon acid sugar kinase family protein n=1 Tax=Actinoallomurus sp. NBC_01490 TaxID=2903557 RepID=UPI002E32FE1E|nr:four-carbon acid sugar kinase family protein [Actinoallomurus sp. NBC_01490]
MTRLVIVADDLTGAGDSAAPFTAHFSVAITVAAEAGWPAADVVAVDTDSRYATAEVAAARVTAALRRASDGGARVFKKIDSLLRGNVGAEVRAAVTALAGSRRPALAVVSAAFPATGRTTRNGVVHVDGRPLTGRRDGDLARVLATAGLTVRRAGPAQVHDPDLAARFAQYWREGVGAVVCDGETDADLAAVAAAAEAAERAGTPILLVGTGGLATALSARAAGRATTARPADPAGETGRRPGNGAALTVIGSHAKEARAQRLALIDDGWIPVVLPADGADVREALARGRVVLSPDPEAPVDRADAPRVARELAAATATVAGDLSVLAVTGGETAHAVLDALGTTEIRVNGELEPGVVAGRLPGYPALFVTKAGAFGDPGTLVRVLTHAAVAVR